MSATLVALAAFGFASEALAACKVTEVQVTDDTITVTGERLTKRELTPQLFFGGDELVLSFFSPTIIEAALPELSLTNKTSHVGQDLHLHLRR